MITPPRIMIIGIVLGTIFSFIVIVLTIAFIALYYRKNKKNNSIGFRFEDKVKTLVSNYAKDRGYKYFAGGVFKYAQTQQFEVDCILISNKAIFIIEIKYFVGHLQGLSTSNQIELLNNKKVKKFKNPLVQNFKHIKHFYKMVGFYFPAFSLVILPQDTTQSIDGLEKWALIANEDNFNLLVDDVEKDMDSEPNLSKDVVNSINDAISFCRIASLKDLKRWEKIVTQDGNK